MTKTSMHRNLLREHLDLYKHAIIWETQLGTKFTDDSQQLERKGLDDFRREIHDNSQIPEKDSKHTHHSSDHNDAEPTIEDAEKVAMVWDHFSRQTTFHGVKYIESKDRRRFSRMFWLLLVLGMAGGLIYTVASLMIEFYEYNTVTKSDIKVAGSTIFPSITLCNNCPYKNGDGSTTSPVFQLMATTANLDGFKINYSDPAMVEFLSMSSISAQNKYSYTQDDLFFSVKYENVYVNATEAFEITKTTYGRCFTFNGPKYIAKHGPRLVTGDGRNSGLRLYVNLHQDNYFIYDDITAGVRMYISQHPETPRLERDGIDIHPGTSARLALTPVQYTFLPSPYKSYGTDTCEELDPVEMSYKMVNSTYYSYDNCLEQCLNYRAALNCSCYSHFLYVPDLAECNMSQMFTCFLPAREEISSESCDCPRPCTFTRHEITMSASQLPSKVSAKYLQKLLNASSIPELREQYLELRVYLDTMLLRHEKHVPQYTFNSIFAFLGGQMGFFMGASLITLAELLETLLFSLYVFVRKKLMRMGQLDTTSTASSTNSAISTISNPIGAKREAWK